MAKDRTRKADAGFTPDASRRTYLGPRRLVEPVEALIGKAGARGRYAEAALWVRWAEVVGPALAAQSVPEGITRGAAGRTLKLKAGPGAALEIQHREPQIIERVNAFLGYGAVARIRIRQATIRPPPSLPRPRQLATPERDDLERRTAAIADPDLAAAMQRLGRAVLGSLPPRT